jgi:DNA-binding NarL/FixJ family response regulator
MWTAPRERRLGRAQPTPLRKIELDLLDLLHLGMTNRDIAQDLRLSVAATKLHLHQLFGKLEARNRIEVIMRTRQVFARELSGREPKSVGLMREPLTKTELDILGSLAQGMTNREIASSLSMTVGTIKWHLVQIFAKLQARNRVEALVRARELNWL